MIHKIKIKSQLLSRFQFNISHEKPLHRFFHILLLILFP